MDANLERFEQVLVEAKTGVQKLNRGEELLLSLGENLTAVDQKATRLELIKTVQAEIGSQFIVWLFTGADHDDTSLKIKLA